MVRFVAKQGFEAGFSLFLVQLSSHYTTPTLRREVWFQQVDLNCRWRSSNSCDPWSIVVCLQKAGIESKATFVNPYSLQINTLNYIWVCAVDFIPKQRCIGKTAVLKTALRLLGCIRVKVHLLLLHLFLPGAFCKLISKAWETSLFPAVGSPSGNSLPFSREVPDSLQISYMTLQHYDWPLIDFINSPSRTFVECNAHYWAFLL